MERPDGYKGLAATYGLRFAESPRIMDLGLLSRALKNKQSTSSPETPPMGDPCAGPVCPGRRSPLLSAL